MWQNFKNQMVVHWADDVRHRQKCPFVGCLKQKKCPIRLGHSDENWEGQHLIYNLSPLVLAFDSMQVWCLFSSLFLWKTAMCSCSHRKKLNCTCCEALNWWIAWHNEALLLVVQSDSVALLHIHVGPSPKMIGETSQRTMRLIDWQTFTVPNPTTLSWHRDLNRLHLS